ncbi:MAG: Tat pathway signal sequence [Eggerthellaceae bacterium]|jgi:hypothetical protein|nr:Tat pathway signal sequence [Eggerthellaceae bacterium]
MDQKSMEDFFKAVGFTPPAGTGKQKDTVDVEPKEAHSDHKRGRSHGSSVGPHVDFSSWGTKALIICAIALILIIAGAYWWFHPPLSIYSVDCWMFAFVFIVLPLFIVLRSMHKRYDRGDARHHSNAKRARAYSIASFVPLAVVVVFVVGACMSLSIWPGNAERYASVLQPKDSDFASDIQEVDYDSIPVIDRDSAVILGNRTLGEIPDYVSQFDISDLYSQINYKGRPVRVSPLNYADFFKWFTNKDTGIPGYVLVDMASQNTQVVRLDHPMYYSESEPFERNIDRYIQLKYPTYMFEQKSFEVDDDGTPWWVCPVQVRTIGLFGGETIDRVVLCNANTGDCQDVAIEDCPEWVDRAYPSELLIQQYNWHGNLSGGWLNSWLGQAGVVQTTPGTNGKLGYNYIAKDDDVWVYTGVTSATADNAIVGFVLVNQRTAEAHYYTVAGATEDSAMRSAKGQVQNLGYDATFPLLLNINGQPTYFMALKDNAGLVKKFAMLDIQRYQNVAVGDTVAECQKSYKSLLATNSAVGDVSANVEDTTGVIKHVTTAVIDGNSHFYLKLQNDEHIYDCPLPSLIEAVGYGQGDTVKLTYIPGDQMCTVQSIEDMTKSTGETATVATP